ncbi:hypothetical protein NHF46_02975 [Arthrobacter alpinus]|nr:hypothetical protein [Arthrobacter alpinus]
MLRRAAARVQALAQWSAGDVLDEADDDVDWVSVAARACRFDSPGAKPALTGAGSVTLVDARTGHNMAAGPTENFLATALASYGVTILDAAELSGAEVEVALMQSQASPAGSSTVLVLIDSLASAQQLETLELVFATAPQAVCINAGLAPASPRGLPPSMPTVSAASPLRL